MSRNYEQHPECFPHMAAADPYFQDHLKDAANMRLCASGERGRMDRVHGDEDEIAAERAETRRLKDEWDADHWDRSEMEEPCETKQ